jgi:hypothetical protein
MIGSFDFSRIPPDPPRSPYKVPEILVAHRVTQRGLKCAREAFRVNYIKMSNYTQKGILRNFNFFAVNICKISYLIGKSCCKMV